MLRKYLLVAGGAMFLSAAVFLVSGCTNSNNGDSDGEARKDASAKNKDAPQKDKNKDEHGHKPGTHGGIIVSLGADSYHAEAVFEKGGLLKLYTLGKEETRVIDVERQVLKAHVKEEGANEAVEMDLNAAPQPGDKPGRTSLFVGKLPKELVGKSLVVTLNITIGDERFRPSFASASAKHDDAMPLGVSGADEKELYLKPGGIYTEADIKANGNMTASQKFKGFKARHDLKPKVGDKICPITLTKANPQCTWIVAGKTYEFCCPPCVDEFVAQAKDPQQSKDLKEPAYYVKKK